MSARGGRTYLVVEADHLITRDLVETVRGLDPGADVLTARDVEEARAALSGVDGLAAGLLSLSSAELRLGEIPRAVEARGGLVVVLDARPASAADKAAGDRRGWIYTGRPFGAGAVARALRGMCMAS